MSDGSDMTGWPGPPVPSGGSWVEQHLFERRIVTISGRLDEAAANRAATQLMTLDALGDGAIDLRLSCAGDSLDAAFVLVDVIDLLGVPVQATCLGRLEGAAVGVAVVAHRRLSAPHARFRLVEPRLWSGRERFSVLEHWVEQAQAQLGRFCDRLAEACGQPPHQIAQDLHTGRYFDARQAKAYGLIDEITGPAPLRVLD